MNHAKLRKAHGVTTWDRERKKEMKEKEEEKRATARNMGVGGQLTLEIVSWWEGGRC